ncbi:T9SS type A sorting domain-containing protein [Spirosoma sp. SC4-14]|uniref:T9SS type A sorting domain-containing protein n=1 Tax=Spirosoma sp. SC4-14 TaxID=3128900 RepID=UPI0030CB54D1
MRTLTLLLLFVSFFRVSYATHLLGGYIQIKPSAPSALTYEIVVIVYYDEVLGKEAASSANSITVCYGDGQTGNVPRSTRIFFNNNQMSRNVYSINHAYVGPGTYTVATALTNRTSSLNIANSATQQVPLALSTTFFTTTLFNQTPTLSIPPTGFQIANKQRVVFPLAATDTEGDSLVYALARPLTSPDNDPCTHRQVAGYQFPNDFTQQGTFKLNSHTGDLIWDAPTQQGQFSVAITVSEYRNGTLISQTSEEIPLIVVDKPVTPGIIPPYEPAMEGVVVTGITEYGYKDASLLVFPNPVDDRLQVVIQTSNPGMATIVLLNVEGRTLHELSFPKAAYQHEQLIDMGSLSPGVYLLRATIGNRSIMQKIIRK